MMDNATLRAALHLRFGMEGVRTLAGYADTSSHGRVRFVISLTGLTTGCASDCFGLSSPRCSRTRPLCRCFPTRSQKFACPLRLLACDI
jgi:hypothetical protein